MVGALPAESGLKRAPPPRQSNRGEPSIAEPRIHTNLWRRGGDSNPRHPFGVKLLSRQPCSATPAPLRSRYPPQFTVPATNFPLFAGGCCSSLCLELRPASREIASGT